MLKVLPAVYLFSKKKKNKNIYLNFKKTVDIVLTKQTIGSIFIVFIILYIRQTHEYLE